MKQKTKQHKNIPVECVCTKTHPTGNKKPKLLYPKGFLGLPNVEVHTLCKEAKPTHETSELVKMHSNIAKSMQNWVKELDSILANQRKQIKAEMLDDCNRNKNEEGRLLVERYFYEK